jgi:hypothetical protein
MPHLSPLLLAALSTASPPAAPAGAQGGSPMAPGPAFDYAWPLIYEAELFDALAVRATAGHRTPPVGPLSAHSVSNRTTRLDGALVWAPLGTMGRSIDS